MVPPLNSGSAALQTVLDSTFDYPTWQSNPSTAGKCCRKFPNNDCVANLEIMQLVPKLV